MSDREVLPTPQYWIPLVTDQETLAWARPEQIVAYGDAPEGLGASWIQFDGNPERVYLLQTVSELHALLGNSDVERGSNRGVTEASRARAHTEIRSTQATGQEVVGEPDTRRASSI